MHSQNPYLCSPSNSDRHDPESISGMRVKHSDRYPIANKKTLLLIDDDTLILRSLRRGFQFKLQKWQDQNLETPFDQIETANSFDTALQRIFTLNDHSKIICDYDLDSENLENNGFELAKITAEMRRKKQIELFIFSGRTPDRNFHNQIIELIKQDIICGFLQKPRSIDELYDEVFSDSNSKEH